jgi:SAM-dependent methyltransferase
MTMSKSTLAETFDDTAERYAEARPGYPECVVDRIVEYGGLTEASRILEIGTGTGKATSGFARRGFRIIGLEPGRRLAQLAQALLVEYPRVEVHCTTFEDWTAAPKSYDLIFAAQSYHWTNPEMRTSKSAALLAPAGTLAIFGSWTELAASPLREQIAAAHARHAPELLGVDPARDWYGSSDVPVLDELRASGRFTDIVYDCFPWQRTLPSQLYCDLLRTYAYYRVVPVERMKALLEEVADAIRANGGEIALGYKTGLILARA